MGTLSGRCGTHSCRKRSRHLLGLAGWASRWVAARVVGDCGTGTGMSRAYVKMLAGLPCASPVADGCGPFCSYFLVSNTLQLAPRTP